MTFPSASKAVGGVTLCRRLIFIPVIDPGAGHTLAQTADFEEMVRSPLE
jgi:hypothetical protein